MTVTERGDGKRASSPDLSYVPLQGTIADGGEERASSEESQRGNNNNTRRMSDERGSAGIPRQDLTGQSILRSNRNTDDHGRTGEELAPLNKRDQAAKDPEDPNIGAPGTLVVPITEFEPPDGGVRAWSVMVASFLINGILFGIINSYSGVYLELQNKLNETNVTDASSKASLPGALAIGTTFLLSPIAGILTDEIGIRTTTFVGGALASSGMLLSCIFHDKIDVLYWTYGVMYGLGASLAYTPSLVILGHYFKRYMGLVNGVVTAGSSVFTVIISHVIGKIIESIHLQGLFGCMAALTATVMGCAILFKPILRPPIPPIDRSHRRSNFRMKFRELVNVSIWKRKRYVVWASIIPLALFGYFVPYVHIGKFVQNQMKDERTSWPVVCISLSSGLGRLLFGYVADKPGVNRILLQQISFISIGVLTMLLPLTPSFEVLLIITLGMGLFDGCFISLLGPIAFDMCGRKDATQAIGFLLGMCAVPLIAGPPIAGKLYDVMGSYDVAFFLAGIPPIVGALAMFLVRCVKDERKGPGEDGTESFDHSRRPLAQPAWQNGNGIKSSGPCRVMEELWKSEGEYRGGRRVSQRTEIGTAGRCGLHCDFYNFFYYNYEREKAYDARSCGSPMCPHRSCHLGSRDVPRYSESEPLLFGTKSIYYRDTGNAGWSRSYRDSHGKHHRRSYFGIRFNERLIYDDQGNI